MYKDLDQKIKTLFSEIDSDIEQLKVRTGLGCPPCDGRCCLSAHIEATPLEMLPAVLRAFDEKNLEALLDVAKESDGPCIFYRGGVDNCNCTIYDLRPTTCRLFGFAAVRDKHGSSRLVTCPVQKETFGPLIEELGLVRDFADTSMQVLSIDPLLGGTHMHINAAFAQMAEKYLYTKKWIQQDQELDQD